MLSELIADRRLKSTKQKHFGFEMRKNQRQKYEKINEKTKPEKKKLETKRLREKRKKKKTKNKKT